MGALGFAVIGLLAVLWAAIITLDILKERG